MVSTGLEHTAIGHELDAVEARLDALGSGEWGLLTDAQLREATQRLLEVQRRVEAEANGAIARVEGREATRELGCSTASWLALDPGETARAQRRRVRVATEVESHPQISEAVHAGRVSVPQAAAICRVLSELPDELGPAEHRKAAETMIDLAADHDPAALSKLSWRLLEVVAPERAEEIEGRLLEEQEARARRNRSLHFFDTGRGTIQITGSLPVLEGRELRTAVDALAMAGMRRLTDEGAPVETGGPAVGVMSQLRADALVELARIAQAGGTLPAHGGDRPRVQIHLDADMLRARTGYATTAEGEPVSLARARQLLCDADVLPVVLDGAGVPVDVGTERRLFTGPVRTAILTRDGGCVFPGCDREPRGCDIHHIVPWWDGGPTSLTNGVTVCRHHHGMIEPRPGHERHTWRVRIADDGLPEFVPPAAVDRAGAPRLHARLHLRRQRADTDPDDPG